MREESNCFGYSPQRPSQTISVRGDGAKVVLPFHPGGRATVPLVARWWWEQSRVGVKGEPSQPHANPWGFIVEKHSKVSQESFT